MVVEALWQRRRRQIDLQLPAAIAALSNSIRAGLTLVQAIQRLAETAPEPIRTDFRVMANRYAFGASVESTIREAKERLASQNFNLFASALLLNREMGGDVAETLARISQSLDKLHQMRQHRRGPHRRGAGQHQGAAGRPGPPAAHDVDRRRRGG